MIKLSETIAHRTTAWLIDTDTTNRSKVFAKSFPLTFRPAVKGSIKCQLNWHFCCNFESHGPLPFLGPHLIKVQSVIAKVSFQLESSHKHTPAQTYIPTHPHAHAHSAERHFVCLLNRHEILRLLANCISNKWLEREYPGFRPRQWPNLSESLHKGHFGRALPEQEDSAKKKTNSGPELKVSFKTDALNVLRSFFLCALPNCK